MYIINANPPHYTDTLPLTLEEELEIVDLIRNTPMTLKLLAIKFEVNPLFIEEILSRH